MNYFYNEQTWATALKGVCHGTFEFGFDFAKIFDHSFLRNMGHLTSRCDAHRRAWLRRGRNTAESDSAVCITLQSQTSSKMLVFVFSNSFCISTMFSSENVWNEKESLNNLWLKVLFSLYYIQASQRNNNFKTLNQNRHLVIYWLLGVRHIAEPDSAMGCTPLSFFNRHFVFMTLQCDAHRGVWLCGMMYTVESGHSWALVR